MKTNHVLFILSSFNIGGAEIDVLNLAKSLITRGYKITVVSEGGELEKKLPETVKTLHVPVQSRNGVVILSSVIRIFLYCLLHRVTIINPQSVLGVLLTVIPAKLLKLSLIATIHNINNRSDLSRAVLILNRLPDVNLFVSEYERRKFIDSGLHPETSRVMYSGIDLKKIAWEKPGAPQKKVIGIIGRLSKEKGVEYGIRAFSRISSQFPDARLMIVGDGPERENLMSLADSLSEDRIEFTGARNDVPELLSRIDFLVLPSLTESLSVVAREAMAAGKPVISSDVGGMSELIKHKNNGLLVPAGDVSALAAAMSTWLQNDNEVRHYGKKVRRQIEQRFSLVQWVNRMNILYRKSVGEYVAPTNARKNILYVTTRFPFPTTKGDKLRAYYQIRELSKKHNVYLLTLLEDESDSQYFTEMEKYCRAIIPVTLSRRKARLHKFLSHFTWIPSQIGYFYSRELKKVLPKAILSKNIDTLYCQLIRAGQYAIGVKNVWKVIDFVDAFSLNLKRNIKTEATHRKPFFYLRMQKIRWFEQKMLKIFDKAMIISENDKKAMDNDQILVIPNGVNQKIQPLPVDVAPEKSVIFTGNMDYWPNEDAARYLVEDILPFLDSNIKVHLVGINNNPNVKKLASDRVVVTGKVPSVVDYIQKATVAVCPMRLGAGQQNKVLEAMTAGVPIVATDIANSGIEASGCLKLENDPKAFANQVNQLVNDPEIRSRLRDQALDFIQRHFNWQEIVMKAENLMWQLNDDIWGSEAQPTKEIDWMANTGAELLTRPDFDQNTG